MGTACRLLYCHCAYARVVPPQVKADVLAALTGARVAFDAVPDLCEMSARRDPRLLELAATAAGTNADGVENGGAAPAADGGAVGTSGATGTTGGTLAIAACYPRAVRWLFSAAGAALPDEGVTILNMRTDSAEAVTKGLLDAAGRQEGER